jgi:hypothetical protein
LVKVVDWDAYTEIPLSESPPRQKYCTAIGMKLFNIAQFRPWDFSTANSSSDRVKAAKVIRDLLRG